MTVVTQFITVDGTDTGDLHEIRRFYVQNGKVIPTRPVTINGQMYDSVTDEFVSAQKTLFGDRNSFAEQGGLKSVGDALDNGMVLVMSLWADDAVHMLWLDSAYPPTKPAGSPGVKRGNCSTSSGDPATVEKEFPNAAVEYSNIKFGPLNSTFVASELDW